MYWLLPSCTDYLFCEHKWRSSIKCVRKVFWKTNISKPLIRIVVFWPKTFFKVYFSLNVWFSIFTEGRLTFITQFIGNKAKGRISKRVFQEKKVRQIFRKTNIFYPLIRIRTCAYQGVRNVSFSKSFAYVLSGWTLAKFTC